MIKILTLKIASINLCAVSRSSAVCSENKNNVDKNVFSMNVIAM